MKSDSNLSKSSLDKLTFSLDLFNFLINAETFSESDFDFCLFNFFLSNFIVSNSSSDFDICCPNLFFNFIPFPFFASFGGSSDSDDDDFPFLILLACSFCVFLATSFTILLDFRRGVYLISSSSSPKITFLFFFLCNF